MAGVGVQQRLQPEAERGHRATGDRSQLSPRRPSRHRRSAENTRHERPVAATTDL